MNYIKEAYEIWTTNGLTIILGVFVALMAIKELREQYLYWKRQLGFVSKSDLEKQNKIDMLNKHEQFLSQEAIDKFYDTIDELSCKIDLVGKDVQAMKNEHNETKIAELRERIIQSHRYYTTRVDKNGKLVNTWNNIEKEVFKGIYDEYIKRGGNGYIKNSVYPDMLGLRVVDNYEM